MSMFVLMCIFCEEWVNNIAIPYLPFPTVLVGVGRMSLIRHFHHPVVSLHHPVVSGGIVLKDRLSAPPRLNVSLPQLVAFAQFVIASHLHAASSFRCQIGHIASTT